MVALVLKPSKEEWQQKRPYQIGASEVAVIAGVSKYGNIVDLWSKKVNKDTTPIENEAMLWGHLFEDGVAKLFETKTGFEVISSSTGDWQFVREGAEWMSCSPDRTYWLDKNPNAKRNARDWAQKGLLECKTTTIDPEAEGNEWLLQSWYCQVQWQLLVAEMTEAHLCCAVFGFERKTVIRHWVANPAFQDKLLKIVTKFWNDVENKVKPTPRTKKDVELLFPSEEEGKEVEASESFNIDVLELRDLKADIKVLEAKEKELVDKITSQILDAEKVTYLGRTLCTYKKSKDGFKFDKERFQTEHPDLFEKYLVPTTGSRSLRLANS